MTHRLRRSSVALSALLAVVFVSAPGGAAPPLMSRDDIICRAKSGVGFSYYWGGACWCASGCSPNFSSCSPGSCSGSCPNCSHSGSYGADCSGYVTKIWQVPDPIATTTCGHGPYVAATYTKTTSYWNVISRANIQRGDSMASSTHVLLYEQGDPWGSMVAYEARGCSYGIVRNWRTCSSSYVAARRINLGTACACNPGQTQSEGCGNCGTRQRTCQSSCQWGAWGACTGQGPCVPGTSETRNCCDCGSQSRTCNAQCDWGAYSACKGPDPQGGNLSCDTKEPGPCAEGRIRCIDGCQTCVRIYEPIDELCDGIDNDCNGDVDDGNPTEMGENRPEFAATVVDSSVPSSSGPREQVTVWAAFRNDGTATWRRNQVWLGAEYTGADGVSDLYDPGAWPAYDVAAILESDVAPGGTGLFVWSVRSPAEGTTASQVFRLMDPTGGWLKCPTPGVEVRLRTTTRGGESEGVDPWVEEAEAGSTDGCSCRTGERPRGGGWWLLLGGVVLWVGRRRGRAVLRSAFTPIPAAAAPADPRSWRSVRPVRPVT
jgi:MYXO-CTERM domain-containing protein